MKRLSLTLALTALLLFSMMSPIIPVKAAPTMLGIEVTQGIQYFEDFGETDRNTLKANNSMVVDVDGNPTFVARKRTLIRVYVDSNGPPIEDTVFLRGYDGAGVLLLPVLARVFTAVDEPTRSDLGDTANFYLDSDHPWVAEPILQLEAQFHGESSSRITISFTSRPVFEVAFIRVRYCPTGNGDGEVDAGDTCYIEPLTPQSLNHPAHVCPAADPCTGGNAPHTHANIRSGHLTAHHMFPFEEIIFTPLGGEVVLDQNINSDGSTLLNRLEETLDLVNFGRLIICIFDGPPCQFIERIYGWVPWRDVPDSFKHTGNGLSDAGDMTVGDERRAIFGNANNDGAKWNGSMWLAAPANLGFPFGSWKRTFAHELAHSMNECSGAFSCSSSSRHLTDPTRLDEHGWDAEYGDTNVVFNGDTIGALKNRDLLDFMVAGKRELEAWVYPRTYQNLWNYIDNPDALFFLEAGSAVEANTAAAPAQQSHGIFMSGVLPQTSSSFTLDPFWRVDRPSIPPPPKPGPYAAEFLDGSAQLLLRVPFDPAGRVEDVECPPEPCPGETPHFAFVTSYPPGTSTIQINNGTSTLNVRIVSASPPTVNILSPQPGTTLPDNTIVRWTTNDQDGDSTVCNILYSRNRGISFSPVALHLRANEYLLDMTGLPGGGNIQLKVSCSDGVNVGESAVQGLLRDNGPPNPAIASPVSGITLLTSDANPQVQLSGSGFDPEDGSLPGTSLQWVSDRDGPLGTGKSILASLSHGTHTITLTATDSGGETGTDSVSFTVVVETPPVGGFSIPIDKLRILLPWMIVGALSLIPLTLWLRERRKRTTAGPSEVHPDVRPG